MNVFRTITDGENAEKQSVIHQLFSQQVKKTPDAVAVTFEDKKLTYRQLEEMSNQLAHYLRAKGVKEETLVPICVKRSLEMIVGILGIMKSGGAYVPIDPEYPQERIAYILNDAGAELIISDHYSQQKLRGNNILLLDEQWETIAAEKMTAPDTISASSNLAYVLYTSGSTGKPKGVMIEHRSLVHYIKVQSEFLGITSKDRILQFSNYCFDASVEQIFLALLNGATLILLPKDIQLDIDKFTSFLNVNAVSHIHATPAFLEQLPAAQYNGLKRVVSGGDRCKKELVERWKGIATFYNKYGPTEATITAVEFNCSQVDANAFQVIPIGKSLPGVPVFIFNDQGQPVKTGETGELYIGGVQVARGYLNKPELTAERFVVQPSGERLYRTGDIVKQLPDGNIEFTGRIDDQVKIRGYRMELGEIENVLQQHTSVKQAVVLARPDKEGLNRLIGYIVPESTFDKETISNYLYTRLPEYMVPRLLMKLEKLPLTHNGKIDKKSLPDPDASELLTNDYIAPKYQTENRLAELWKELLGVKKVGTADNFFELGGNSLLAQKTVALLKQQYSYYVPVTKLYQYPTVAAIAAFIDGRTITVATKKRKINPANKDVAVIGMAGRFPGAASIEELWTVLKEGRETTRFFKDDELDPSIPVTLKNNPDYVKARGILENIGEFDASFFGITPKLAELMDPQQRIFLEIAWEALENAGHVPQKYDGIIGVYAGCRYNTYYINNVIPNKNLIERAGNFLVTTVNDKDYIASRTAYSLNLKGPAVTVQSACSTSLLAIAQAVEGIRKGQCDVALAGGASVSPPVNSGHLYEEGAMLSKDGHCRPFDANAAGTVFSDGAGVVVLKSREQAEADGDTIYAIIKGVGINNDGGGKGSFTAPSAEGQAAAITMALEDGAVDPSMLSYIEAHGTATPLGDPIEIEGLNIAFGQQEKKQYCAIGSIKSNMGHLTNAAGVAGFIKTVLSLYHKQLPPSLFYTTPNPNIDFSNSSFIVNNTLKDWATESIRKAGVSSFGVGGTNVHVVLEEAHTTIQKTTAGRPVQLISWSAKAEDSLDKYGDKLAGYIKNNKDVNLADVAYTLHNSRQDFDYRRFAVVGTNGELLEKLTTPSSLSTTTKKAGEPVREIVFMFPGQGAQYVNMGKDLYQSEEVFRLAMDECAALLKNELEENILDVIYPAKADEAATNKLKNTCYSQPALFSIGYSLARLWMSWGIYPSAFIGHSIGEFVAAHLSGVFTLADAIKLIATRGRLMSELPGGSMLSVRTAINTIQPLLPADIAVAAVNSPNLCVVAGTTEAIDAFSKILTDKEIQNKLLHTSHAFHSHMMEPVVTPFKSIVQSVRLSEPVIPIASTVTGKWLTAAEATDPSYWATHLRSTVLFADAAAIVLEEPHRAFLELGPGNVTATLTRQQAAGKKAVIMASLEQEDNNTSAFYPLLKALGQLWMNGVAINWNAFYANEKREKLTNLPTYAFNRKMYWVNPLPAFPVLPSYIPQNSIINDQPLSASVKPMRKQELITNVKKILENASGIEMQGVTPDMSFIEMGLDSLLLTQVALTLKKEFRLPITFRQLNEEYGTLDLLAGYLDANLPANAVQTIAAPATLSQQPLPGYTQPAYNGGANPAMALISQQLQLLAQQVALMQGMPAPQQYTTPVASAPAAPIEQPSRQELSIEEAAEIKKPFGAAPKIEKQSATLSAQQQQYLSDLIKRYNQKTKGSKEYTQKNRAHMADPRVVSGFKPATKELVYSIVINKSKGSRLWDIDGNEYIDALNGFGSNLLGYQPDVIKKALIEQIEKGYEIGPQHELAGEVTKLICEFTGFDRSALCNTGSEAVLGAMRIARTVTGRSLIVAFANSYHGIVDEVIVRGSKKGKTFPAASGIMPEAVQNMLVLDYGTDEALKIIQERADEIAAVLVEPVQSRRAEFQPIEFLKKLRKITEETETVLIFDEVISGFRFHPGGMQAIFGIRADIGTYGKVVGGGMSIGIIAGKKKYMDALDGGFWQYGDGSVPEIGVTYFAGTFVRHPLALATAKASLTYMKEQGPQLQERLNANGTYIANTLNALFQRLKVPMFIAQYGSLWRIKFKEEYPYTELFFTLMRYKGIHILEGFSCFVTAAHTKEDIEQILRKFEESLLELKEAGFIPEYEHGLPETNGTSGNGYSLSTPPVPNARLGKDKDGNPAWFIADEKNPGKYLKVN